MSDIPHDWRQRLDLQAELDRLDRDRAETQKLLAEGQKLLAERDKFNRDIWVLVLTALITGFAAIVAAVTARLPEILHAMGIG